MKTSEQTNEIAAALSKAQAKIKNPEKTRTADYPTKTGGRVRYKYAGLPECFDAARDALSENGLSHSASAAFVEKDYTLYLRLTHSSGQWYQSEWPLPNAEPKIVAAHMTYGTRYLFCAMIGISGDEDMDAEPEEGGKYGDTKPRPQPTPGRLATGAQPVMPSGKKPSEAQIKRLYTIASASKWTHEQVHIFIEKRYGVKSTQELSIEHYNEFCNGMPNVTFEQGMAHISPQSPPQEGDFRSF